MSASNKQPSALRLEIEGVISGFSKADKAAVRAVAQKIRDAIAEGEAQEPGVGMIGLALIGAEMQEQQA